MNVPQRLSTTRTMRHCVLGERPQQRRAWMPPKHLEQSTSRQRSACSAADSNGSSVFVWHRTGSNMACVYYRTGMQIYIREKKTTRRWVMHSAGQVRTNLMGSKSDQKDTCVGGNTFVSGSRLHKQRNPDGAQNGHNGTSRSHKRTAPQHFCECTDAMIMCRSKPPQQSASRYERSDCRSEPRVQQRMPSTPGFLPLPPASLRE